LAGGFCVLRGLAALDAAAPMVSAVRPAASAPSSPANGTRQESREHRMELRDPVLGDVDDDLLILRTGSWI
jgi:hypothetical protein